ncbi:MAG: tetratricopeptide repeat protein [Bacteroidota bacterium]
MKNIFFCIALLCCISAAAQPETDEQLAVQYFQNKEYDKALSIFETLYTNNPTPLYYNYYLDCLIESGNFKKAEKFLGRQIKKYAGEQKYLVDLGYAYQREGQGDDARKQYELALKQLQPDQQAVIDLANAFLTRDLADYAVMAYQKGKKLLKGGYPFCMEMAAIYQKKGDWASVFEEYLNLCDFIAASSEDVQNKMQDIIADDADGKRGELFRTMLLDRIKKEPQKTWYSELLMWYFIQQKDFASALMQAKSLDKRLGEDGNRVFKLGGVAASNKDYETAAECYDYIITKKGNTNPYYFQCRLDKINVKYLKISSSISPAKEELLALEKEYQAMLSELGTSAQTIVLMKNLAHLQAFYLDKMEDAKALLNQAIETQGSSPDLIAQCKIELADIMLMSGEVWDASLLYSQVEKAFKYDPIGFEAKFKNAKLYYYNGEFDYAKAQLDVLKAATAKLIANDAMELALLIGDNMDPDDSTYVGLMLYSKADMYVFQNKYQLALTTLDSINMLGTYHPLFDEVLYKKAQIMIRTGDFAMADTLLQKLIDFYPSDILADDALLMLAKLNEEQFKNKEKAMELYQKLLTEYPGSINAVEARMRFRSLRGDKVN